MPQANCLRITLAFPAETFLLDAEKPSVLGPAQSAAGSPTWKFPPTMKNPQALRVSLETITNDCIFGIMDPTILMDRH